MASTNGQCRVELMITCQDLADLDVFTKTDPMCVLFVKQFGQWKEYGRTEAIRETLNPRFCQSFIVDYEPTIQQPLLFSLYDIDSRSMDLRHHDFVGSVEVRLEDLLDPHASLHTTTRNLRVPADPKSRGLIHITAEVLKPCRGKVQAHIAGIKLDKVGVFKRKPDTFLEVGRQINTITYQPVFRSEVVSKTRNPWWRPFDISIQRLCNDDWDRPIQLSCWHTSFGGGVTKTFEMLGQCTTTLRQIVNMPLEGHYRTLSLKSIKKELQNKKKTVVGTLRVYQFKVDMQYSLLDYIRGGCKLRLITAIDFTSSNGVITDPLSLHSLEAARDNQYLNALDALGSVIARYDPEQRVGAFGFGAKTSLDAPTDHCLPLASDTWVKGIKGVSDAYQHILPSLTFAGPTYIGPILDKVISMTSSADITQDDQSYYVLLVITDGIINDMDAVVKKLVAAGGLPLSVIVLGVGPSDFSLMDQFHHASNAPVFDTDSKKAAVRPNYHFAALKSDGMTTGAHGIVVQEALASLSSQVLQYMKMKNISPGAPKMTRMDPSNNWIDSHTLLEGEDNGDPLAYLNWDRATSPSTFGSTTSMTTSVSQNTLIRHGSTRGSVKRNGSQRNSTPSGSGLLCPTCGSCLEPGSAIYSDVLKMS